MSSSGKAKDDLDAAIRQLVSQSIVPNGIVDIALAPGGHSVRRRSWSPSGFA